MTRTLSFVAAALFAASTLVAQEGAAASNPWHADFDVAVAKAKELKKDLLVDFTGSDWCGWCIKLHDEVFKFDSFLGEIQKEYVLCALDFPNGDEAKAKVPKPERNQELMTKYGVRGFPSILLMTVDGEVFAKTGYQEGGPEKYLAHVKEIATKGKDGVAAAKKLKAAWDAAKDADKAGLVEKAAAALEGMSEDAPGIEVLAPIVKEAYTLDPENKAGLKLKATKALLKAGQGDAAVMDAAKALDPKNENGLYEQVVASKFQSVQDEESCRAALAALTELDGLGGPKDKKQAAQLYAMAAIWSAQNLNEPEAAKSWAKKALDLKPDNERMVKMLEKIAGN